MSDINKFLNIKKPDDTDTGLQPSQISDNKATIILMKIWNNHPATGKQISHPPRHSASNTKVHRRARKYLSQLLNGTFAKNKTLSEKQVKRLPSIVKLSKKKYLLSELKASINKLGWMYDDKHQPENKRHLPKSLPDLLYNPKTGYSFFLETKAKLSSKSKINTNSSLVFDKNVLLLIPIKIPALAPQQQKLFLAGILTLETFYNNISGISSGKVKYHLPTFTKLINEYVIYLADMAEKMPWNTKPCEYWYFKTDCREWKQFIKHLEYKIGVTMPVE